ncbi:MAG: SDR family NAD(P)-dependent oxidoreductase [Komarekiella atlantica HA4396-MV6]|jgi:NAD(P)-dependent dehydrogenase (short-subunit alcohol dehydrogenase family)|nr:SDR family NAD(P)-dependent oxidoreductase [Komarekiella atlantica HA4396-MV6]
MKVQPSKLGKTVIITGGNRGLGYECAKAIAAFDQDWHVIIASRNHKQATLSVKQLVAQTGNRSIELIELDLASLASIRAFAKDFAASNCPPLHAIVCNAGIQIVTRTTYTKDGFESTFGVNHLGHFLLVNLLLQHLVSPSRIIFVSSGTHLPNEKLNHLINIPSPKYCNARLLAFPESACIEEDILTIGLRRYTTSKLCNILCAYELAHRLQSQGYSTQQQPITVNVFDPGLMPGTGIARDYNSIQRFAWNFLLPGICLFVPYANSTNKSGKNLARLILAPEFATVTGKYFVDLQQVRSSKESYDRKKAAELWQTSAQLVNLAPDETFDGIKENFAVHI